MYVSLSLYIYIYIYIYMYIYVYVYNVSKLLPDHGALNSCACIPIITIIMTLPMLYTYTHIPID